MPSSLWDYFRPQPRPGPFEPFNSRVTYYAPGPGDRMEGGFETSQPNPITGKRVPSTLDDVRLGTSPFVTLASDPSRYGQTINMGPQTYTSPIDRKQYTLPNVTGYVHDTGAAFQGRPDKLDVATGDFRGWSPQQASALVTADAGNRTVTPLSGDEADQAMRPIGLPEPWRATGEGESPADAYASGPGGTNRGPKMPTSLMDMFQPTNAGGQPSSLGEALASRSNSLIGLGLGLMSPAWQGQSVIGNALQGYQGGAAQDAAQARFAQQMAHTKTQEARQAAQDAFNRQMALKQFAQSTLTPYQKMQSDLARTKGTPDEQATRAFYRTQLDAGPPQQREVFDRNLGRNVVQEWDDRNGQWKTAVEGSGATATPNPFTTPGTGGVSYGNATVGNRGVGSGTPTGAVPGYGATGSTQAQPLLPPQKPLTAHEQTAIDEADKALMANQQAIGNLQYAKQLSKKAASGPFALERGQAGSLLGGGMLGEGGKETVMLHNVIVNNAVDQLKATFGGNPSEGERKILLEMAGSANLSDEARQEIYDRGIRLAKDKLAENARRAQQIRGGTYYQPGGGATGGPATPSAAGAVRRYNPATGSIE